MLTANRGEIQVASYAGHIETHCQQNLHLVTHLLETTGIFNMVFLHYGLEKKLFVDTVLCVCLSVPRKLVN